MSAEEAQPQPETIGLIEAAALLHIGREALRTLCERGEIPALSLNRKHWVLLRSDVLAYIGHTARQQAAARRRLCESSAPQIEASPARKAAGKGRPRREMPDLAPYETRAGLPTKDGRRGPRPEDSRNA